MPIHTIKNQRNNSFGRILQDQTLDWGCFWVHELDIGNSDWGWKPKDLFTKKNISLPTKQHVAYRNLIVFKGRGD